MGVRLATPGRATSPGTPWVLAEVVNGLTSRSRKVGAAPRHPVPPGGAVGHQRSRSRSSRNTTGTNPAAVDPVHHRALLFVFRSLLALCHVACRRRSSCSCRARSSAESTLTRLKSRRSPSCSSSSSSSGRGPTTGLFLVFRVREGLRSGLTANDAVGAVRSHVSVSRSAHRPGP